MSLEEKLIKIRSPNLQSQHHTRVVLESIEETLKEQKTSAPSAYFAALLALLKQSGAESERESQKVILTSAVYLLDLVTSHVSAGLLRSQFSTIAILLAPSLDPSSDNTLLIRSATGCLESLLIAQDSLSWNIPQSQLGPRQAVSALLNLAVDSRPKIRKRATEALTNLLKNPPPGPSVDHQAAELCAVAAQNQLKDTVAEVNRARKQRRRPDDSHDPIIIHALQLTKTVAIATGGWPSKNIEQLCEILLNISRSRSDYLVMSAFEVFEVIISGMQDEQSSVKLPRLLDAIIELKPNSDDSQLLPPWIAILSRGYGAYAELEADEAFAKVPQLCDLAATFLVSPSHDVRVSASECMISFFANCIPDSAILDPSVNDEKLLQRIADRALGLLSVKFQSAWMEVFNVLSALLDALKWRGVPYLLPIVQSVGELRGSDGFQGKSHADSVLGHAIRNLGPQAVLSVLPHNLSKPQRSQPGRAWLLPLLRDHVSNTSIQHFKEDLVPLSETMYERVMNHSGSEKTMDIKVYETVVQQVWATLPGYCDAPIDLPSAMDQAFAELIANLLYQQADLRVDLCRGLQNLVESNQAITGSGAADDVLMVERRMRKADAEKNLDHLSTLAPNFLAVLFNVYSQTLPHKRAHILQCINAYLSITSEQDLINTFQQTSQMLESKLPAADIAVPKKQAANLVKDKLPPESHTLLDLIIALSIYLPRSTFAPLFALASSILTNTAVLTSDPQLIKKVYKLIPRLATSEVGRAALQARNAELQQLILSTSDKTPVPARRDRLLAVNTLVSFLPTSDLHFIPSIISEIVLACKDTNEKARNAGFETLLSAANKIASPSNPANTMIRNSQVPHISDDAPDARASLEEVFTMVSAGLAGVAPHMVAASITALSRLLFEFARDEHLSQAVTEEVVDTVTMFLQSNNREIVRSVLGFVKVMVVVLPLSILDSRCEVIILGLMAWSKENKGRLRIKVKGILERLIRRFGSDKVESWVGDEDRKMVVNIRKQRERAKRKKQNAGDSNSDEEDNDGDHEHENEFDDAVYQSDASDSDGEHASGDNDESDDASMAGVSFKSGLKSQAGMVGRKQRDRYIRQEDDGDEPLDLLDPKSMAAISSSRRSLPKLHSGPLGQRKSKARYNEDGKLVFDNDTNDQVSQSIQGRRKVSQVVENEAAEGDAINSYLDAVSGPDAVRRGQKGKLKVKSGIQKASRSEGSGGGDEMDLDINEAREVARKIIQGGGNSTGSGRGGLKPHSPIGKSQNQRRGLGQEKQRGEPQSHHGRGHGRGYGGGSGNKKFKKGVRFSRHPRR